MVALDRVWNSLPYVRMFAVVKSYFYDFWSKFGFLVKIWIFEQNLDFLPKFRFLTKIWIFDQNLDFWPKFGFLNKIWIFWPKFGFFTEMSIFNQKIGFSTKIWIFDQNFDFWPKFIFLTKISIFDKTKTANCQCIRQTSLNSDCTSLGVGIASKNSKFFDIRSICRFLISSASPELSVILTVNWLAFWLRRLWRRFF